jgi:hypothetical protein
MPIGIDIETSFPLVKPDLYKQEEVRKFFKELGIPELDIVEEVINNILPKYSSPVPIEEHIPDIEKIKKAYKTDSQDKKNRLKSSLQQTAFIRAINPCTGKICYKKPEEIYLMSDYLNIYFEGNESVFFVHNEYEKSALEIFEDLGVNNQIIIKCKSNMNSLYDIPLQFKRGYRRGLAGFDPDILVEGIEHPIMNPSIERSKIIWNEVAIKYKHCIKGEIHRSSWQNFSEKARVNKIETDTSYFGKLLIDNFWIPDCNGNFYKPSELTLDDLPESFIKDEKLAQQLGMKSNVIAKLAAEFGASIEALQIAKQLDNDPEMLNKVKKLLADKEKPPFPVRTEPDHERRQEKLQEQLQESPEKQYENRLRSVRTTRDVEGVEIYLREQYTNEAGQMICQICKEEMPFKKKDGNYYFEKVDAFSKEYFTKEHEAQFLALCPVCAAMYKEFVKYGEKTPQMDELKEILLKANNDKLEVPLKLGTLETSLRFVESHWIDIKTILGSDK